MSAWGSDWGRLPATAADWRLKAQARLPRFLFDYVDGGATDEQTLRANEAAWAGHTLRQRVLVDVDGVDTRTALLGQPCSLPLALAPIGWAGLMARRGEVQAARAAEAVGVPFTLSTVGICPLAEVMGAVQRPPWFQLYMLRDRGIVRALLQRAWAAGCRTLVFTVDLPISGMRHRDTRNGLAMLMRERIDAILLGSSVDLQRLVRDNPDLQGATFATLEAEVARDIGFLG